MAKNIVQLHERVKFWMDISRTPRFSEKMIDNAINVAIADIIKDRFVPSNKDAQGQQGELKGFQRSNTIREELRTLTIMMELTAARLNNIKDTAKQYILSTDIADQIIANNNAFPGSYANYGYYTMFELVLSNGEKLYPVETTQEKLDFMIKDPYQRPTIEAPARVYFIENATGYKFYTGALDTLTIDKAFVYYLGVPSELFYGFEKTLAVGCTGPSILVQESATVKNPSNADISVKIGDIIETTAYNNTSTAKVVTGYTDLNMPDILFDEIAKVAASHLLMIVSRTSQQQQQQ